MTYEEYKRLTAEGSYLAAGSDVHKIYALCITASNNCYNGNKQPLSYPAGDKGAVFRACRL